MLEILKSPSRQQGFTLIGVIMSAAIIGIGIFAVLGGTQSLLKTTTALNSEVNLSQFRAAILTSLGSGESLSRTIANNPDMVCVRNGTDCSAKKNADWPVSVYRPDGTLLTDRLSATFGFTSQGATCTGFSAAAPNDRCPYRFEITWRPICPPAGPCTNPQNHFRGTLRVSSNATINYDLRKFNFSFFPSKLDSTLEAHCKAVGGTFNPGPGTCGLPMEGLCPNGQIVVRLDSNNRKFCAPLFSGVCPSGQTIDYIAPNGGLICKVISFCPAGTRFGTWVPFGPDLGGDGGDGSGDGCDGTDGADGCS